MATPAAFAAYLLVGAAGAALCPGELNVSGPVPSGVSGTYRLDGTSFSHPRYVQVSWEAGARAHRAGAGGAHPHYIRYWWSERRSPMWGLSAHAEGRHFEAFGPGTECPDMKAWSDPDFDGGANLTVRAQDASAPVPSTNGRCKISPMNSGFFGYCDVCDPITSEAECRWIHSSFNCCVWVPSAAACDFPHSNNVTGAGCACADGYTGIVRSGAAGQHADCARVPCVDRFGADPRAHSWLKDSSASYPYCECGDGYAGKVWWGEDGFGWTTLGEGWDGPERYGGSDGSLWWKCRRAPCSVANSNNVSGPGCACAEGYSGNLTWAGPEEECGCAGEGPSCRCDGSWRGVCAPTRATLTGTEVAGESLSTTGKSSQGQVHATLKGASTTGKSSQGQVHATLKGADIAGKFLSTAGEASQGTEAADRFLGAAGRSIGGQASGLRSAAVCLTVVALLLLGASRVSITPCFPGGAYAPFMPAGSE